MPIGLVTGASRGLGAALARALSERRWQLIVDGRDGVSLHRAMRGLAGDHAVIPGDVTDPGHREELRAAVQEAGRLDLLVNNASTLGPTPLPPLVHHPLAELERVFATNTFAPLALIQALVPFLTADASIVNVTSDAAVEPYEGWGGYGSSKAALDQISAVLAAEQADWRVYSFDPGDMRTKMHQDAFPGEDISDRPEPETVVPALLRLIEERPPSGRYRAGDLAALASSTG